MVFPPDARVICETGYEDYERIAVLEQINFKQKSHYETEDGRQILIFESWSERNKLWIINQQQTKRNRW